MADYPLDSVPDRKPFSMPAPGEKSTSEALYDVLVIGAGPTGLSCAIENRESGDHAPAVSSTQPSQCSASCEEAGQNAAPSGRPP